MVYAMEDTIEIDDHNIHLMAPWQRSMILSITTGALAVYDYWRANGHSSDGLRMNGSPAPSRSPSPS